MSAPIFMSAQVRGHAVEIASTQLAFKISNYSVGIYERIYIYIHSVPRMNEYLFSIFIHLEPVLQLGC